MNPTLRAIALIIIGIGVATAFFWTGLTIRLKTTPGNGSVVVEKYNKVPPGFPDGLIPSGVPLRYAQITTQGGQKTYAVAMNSTLSMPAQVGALQKALQDNGWEIKEQRISASGIIEAVKGEERLSATVTAESNQSGLLVVVLTYIPLPTK